jgi:5'-deoxynucleotidase YfbR-like HD superfamily hydrolase
VKISKKDLKEIIEEEIKATINERAELKIPVERYDAFKRKIEQWAMLYGKFTRYTKDLNHETFDRRTHGKRIVKAAHKLERELRKILEEFDMEYKDYGEERYAMRQKLDQFDGDSEMFMGPLKEGYYSKGKCVYKKEDDSKVGCTDGPVKDYLAALYANVEDAK